MTLRCPAPAKLNLFLHVTGRRPDGYHSLQTVFQLIDLCDWVTVSVREDGQIVRERPLPGVPMETDLTVRAARLLREYAGVEQGATIDVEKRIPLGSGLGGGSSDAATTLMALNRLWQLDLSPSELAELGLQLGADVPFFLHGRNAWAEGVGEIFTPIDLPPAWYVVIVPGVAVSTASIFGASELTRDTKPLKITSFFAGRDLRNDLEPVVREKFPPVAQALEWLQAYGEARMSGAGSSVFAVFDNEAAARAVAAEVPSGWRGYAVRGLQQHPWRLQPNSDGTQ